MKTTWVLTEEERMLMFVRKGNKRKNRVSAGGSISVSVSSSVPPGQMPLLGLCETDLNNIQQPELRGGRRGVRAEQSGGHGHAAHQEDHQDDHLQGDTRPVRPESAEGCHLLSSLKFVTIIEVSVVVTKD